MLTFCFRFRANLGKLLLLKSDEDKKYFLAFDLTDDAHSTDNINQIVTSLNSCLKSMSLPSYYKVIFKPSQILKITILKNLIAFQNATYHVSVCLCNMKSKSFKKNLLQQRLNVSIVSYVLSYIIRQLLKLMIILN